MDSSPGRGGPVKVPAGATGFSPDPQGAGTFNDFASSCEEAARSVGGSVVEALRASQTPSFDLFVIDNGREQVALLRHATVPIVAFAEPLDDDLEAVAFVDRPALADVFARLCEVEVWTVADLATEVSQADLTALAPDEHRQVTQWKPDTVGELMFNFWD